MKPHRITKIIRETPDVVTLQFVNANDSHLDFIAGQYVTVLFPDLDVPEGKAYSLSSAPTDKFMSITVKKLGQYSSRLHSLKVGDELLVSEPYGFLNPQFDSPLVLIAGGVGIAPLWSILRDTLTKDPTREIELWYSNQNVESIVFQEDLEKLKKQFKGLRVRHFLTRADKIPRGYEKGRIKVSQQSLKPESFYFICGRQSFVGDIWHDLVAAGVLENKIATETFY